jgi:hypothetical protein
VSPKRSAADPRRGSHGSSRKGVSRFTRAAYLLSRSRKLLRNEDRRRQVQILSARKRAKPRLWPPFANPITERSECELTIRLLASLRRLISER